MLPLHSIQTKNRKAVGAGNSECCAKRGSADAWNTLRGAVERQHAAIAKTDTASPRVRPTLGCFLPHAGRGAPLQRAVLRDANGQASTPLGAAIDLIVGGSAGS